MEENSNSVYYLITSLCEKFFTSQETVKIARSNCYEILLKKKLPRNPRKFRDLEGIHDPMISLLAWCYKLTQEYEFPETAQALEKCAENLKDCYGSDANSFNNVLTFLLCLKDWPKKTDNKLDLSTLPEIDDQISRFENLFKLPVSLSNGSIHKAKSEDLFQISYEFANNAAFKARAVSEDMVLSKCEMLKDEGYSSPDKENIWDIASQMTYSKRRNWESYGCGPPDKEKPFLSELGELSSLWVENLESLYLANNLFPSFTIITNKLKPRKIFIRDLKNLLVGMPSETFNLSSQEEFFISPGIMVEGITPDTIERYCSRFLFCGTCYRALNYMATPNANTRKYKYPGYVFTEFCESVFRYLQFYRTTVLSIPDEIKFLNLHEKTCELQTQISSLASICKVGPYASKTEQVPHGVALLNYLYQKVLGLCDKKLCMVLYSILYPCCQIYFSRFLYQWLIKGTLNDPYGEFFVTPNLKYLSTRGRTYWTRSYAVREDIIPDFLVDLKDDILFCGRIMNLLQLCAPWNKLCVYLMGKNPLVLTCCLTHDKLTQLEQNSSKYYLEASAECGSKLNFTQILEKSRESDITYRQLIAKKRAATLRRIELERQRAAQEQREKKIEELSILKEQYESALEQKQLNVYRDIEKEINTLQENLRIDEMREKLIEEEAGSLIDYYKELCELVDNRKERIENHIKTASKIYIDAGLTEKSPDNKPLEDKANSSSESFYSAPEDCPVTEMGKEELVVTNKEPQAIRSSDSMDLLNANVDQVILAETSMEGQKSTDNICNPPQSSNTNLQQVIYNFELARKIKQKVLNEELGIFVDELSQKHHTEVKQKTAATNLTAAQRNKLKILSSEFGIDVIRDNVKTDRVLTVAQVNRNKVLGHNECFVPNYGKKPLDNESFLNKNVSNMSNNIEKNDTKLSSPMKKSKSLQLDFDKFSIKSDFDKPVPMSVDSTPLSDLPQTVTPSSDFPRSVTPTSMILSIDTKLDSLPTTGETHQTEDIFSFTSATKISDTHLSRNQANLWSRNHCYDAIKKLLHLGCLSYRDRIKLAISWILMHPSVHYIMTGATHKLTESRGVPTFSKRVTVDEANGISKNSLKLFLHESVSIPLLTQLKLANNEILKYFVKELNYLEHLESLRDYFFLQDGEFGRNITENLFEKLYNANFPLELINCRTLQHLVFSALDNSSKFQENSKHLSFKINSLPKCFDLGDPDVLDCLSLTYKVNWPLNILLPSDAVAKYDQVFKFLVKLNRVSWVLKKIFLELKVLAKETGKKEIYLMSSPQYRRLHQCRHVMSHFMQTLQNYIVGEVLRPSWALFEKNLMNVTNIDEMYNAHTSYIKGIIFRCMLNQKSVALRSIIHKIFVVILKFYDYLRSRRWKCEDGSYVHPNFNKLDKIFKNFEELVVYFFKVVTKVAKSGYQPHLIQFLDVLNVNDYYSRKLLKAAS